jgi:DNA-binding MarR family transcriptional regulator
MTPADDASPALLRDKPSWLISQISTHAHRLLTERLAAAGMRGYHFRLLAALDEFGPASQASLGRRTDMDRSDVAAAVTELVGQKLAARVTDQADRRRNIITISASGRARLRQLDTLLAGIQDELLTPLSSAERRALVSILSRVLDYLDTPEPPPSDGGRQRARPASAADRPQDVIL